MVYGPRAAASLFCWMGLLDGNLCGTAAPCAVQDRTPPFTRPAPLMRSNARTVRMQRHQVASSARSQLAGQGEVRRRRKLVARVGHTSPVRQPLLWDPLHACSRRLAKTRQSTSSNASNLRQLDARLPVTRSQELSSRPHGTVCKRHLQWNFPPPTPAPPPPCTVLHG